VRVVPTGRADSDARGPRGGAARCTEPVGCVALAVIRRPPLPFCQRRAVCRGWRARGGACRSGGLGTGAGGRWRNDGMPPPRGLCDGWGYERCEPACTDPEGGRAAGGLRVACHRVRARADRGDSTRSAGSADWLFPTHPPPAAHRRQRAGASEQAVVAWTATARPLLVSPRAELGPARVERLESPVRLSRRS
jgi:hypothetical protein